MPKIVIAIRVDPALKTAIERVAKAERRTVSGLLEKLAAEYVEKAERSKKRKD